MTTEEKAKAYDEALKRIKNLENTTTEEEALIKYIFPELKESEDERIRKELVEKISKLACGCFISEEQKQNFITYLEKQKINTEGDFGRGYDCGYEACLNSHGAEWFKKQKHPNGCFTCDEYKKGYEEGRRNGFTAGYNKAMKEVEQKEQKPVEIHIDNPNIEKFDPNVKITTSDSSADRKVYCEEVRDAFEPNSNINIPEKQAEWSEEDEKTINDAYCWLCEYAGSLIQKNYEKSSMLYGIADKLKSIPPQSKEELAKMLQNEYNNGKAAGKREGYTKGYNKGYKDANESLSYHFPIMPTTPSGWGCDGTHCTNPQMDCINCPKKLTGGMFNTASSSGDPTLKADWKPSEEQMEALNALNCHGGLSYVGQQNQLISLYDDLKKLM